MTSDSQNKLYSCHFERYQIHCWRINFLENTMSYISLLPFILFTRTAVWSAGTLPGIWMSLRHKFSSYTLYHANDKIFFAYLVFLRESSVKANCGMMLAFLEKHSLVFNSKIFALHN